MDKEIQEMFKEKNKEIIKNNLQLDIERNINSLSETLTNIFNNNFDIAIKNIISMYEDSFCDNSPMTVTKLMNRLKLSSFNLLDTQIIEKKKGLISEIEKLEFSEPDMEEYYQLVFKTTEDLENVFNTDEFCNYQKDIIKEFDKYTESILDNNSIYITKSRINDYITHRLFGKIKEQSHSEFALRDNSLANKGKESYLKYQEISSKTTNV